MLPQMSLNQALQASECNQLSAHNFVGFCLQTTSTIVEVLRCRSPFRSLPSRPICWTLTQMRCRTVAVHRHWDGSLWATTTIADEAPRTLFVASHWLERSSCLSQSYIQSSRSRLLHKYNHVSCGFYHNFFWRLASKFSTYQLDLLWLVHGRDVRHTPRLIARTIHIFRSLLKIFEYAAKQECNQPIKKGQITRSNLN